MRKFITFFISMLFVISASSVGICKDLSSQHSEWKALKKKFADTCKGIKKCKTPSFKSDLGPSFDTLMKLEEEKDRKAVSKKAEKVINDIVKAVKAYKSELAANENANKKSLDKKDFSSLEKLYLNMNVNLIYFEDYAEGKRKLFK